jgi:hypothetical protein
MTQQYVIPESDTNKARYAVPAFQNVDGEFAIAGSVSPLPTQDLSLLRLEEGKAFALGVVRSFSDPLPASQSIDIAIAFASDVTPNISISGLCAGNAMGFLYEGAVVTGGTAITALNKNRNSLITSQSAALSNPTVTTLGTPILSQILIGGEGKKAGGGDVGSSDLILKPLTTYLFRLTNVNGTAHAAEIVLEWYE